MTDDSTPQLTLQVRQAVLRQAREGGYLDTVMRAGGELARLQEYLRILEGHAPAPPSAPGQAPVIFPPYPGLEERPWREPSFPAARTLEQHAAEVQQELTRLEHSSLLNYDADIVRTGNWSVHPVFFGGERVDRLFWPERAMDATARLVQSLEGECTGFPLADVLFSAHTPGTRLSPHCSWDGFRMRLHLGLRIPPGCGIRVGTESRHWQANRVLVFHDSFEHETWNDSQERRVVLIVDCWHPGLTPPEREALLALTRKFEVRKLLIQLRLPEALQPPLLERFLHSEQTDPLVRRYWRA